MPMKKSSILISACDSSFSRIIGKRFGARGWKVALADTLIDTERKAAKQQPDILLLHSNCLVNPANEIKRLRAMPTLQKTKLVILTPHGNAEEMHSAMNAGADGYLVRGQFSTQDLVEQMHALLNS